MLSTRKETTYAVINPLHLLEEHSPHHFTSDKRQHKTGNLRVSNKRKHTLEF